MSRVVRVSACCATKGRGITPGTGSLCVVMSTCGHVLLSTIPWNIHRGWSCEAHGAGPGEEDACERLAC